MLSKKMINLYIYLPLTAINFAATLKIAGMENLAVLGIVFAAILANHAALLYSSHLMLNTSAEERNNGLIGFLFFAKMITLAFAIWYGMNKVIGNQFTVIINYIFQLIILTLSIKKYSKKIKENL